MRRKFFLKQFKAINVVTRSIIISSSGLWPEFMPLKEPFPFRKLPLSSASEDEMKKKSFWHIYKSRWFLGVSKKGLVGFSSSCKVCISYGCHPLHRNHIYSAGCGCTIRHGGTHSIRSAYSFIIAMTKTLLMRTMLMMINDHCNQI